MDEEPKEVFSNSVTLSKKLELDLHVDNFTEFLAAQQEELTNEDLMELEAQRKDQERQEEEEVAEEPKRFKMQDMSRFSFFFYFFEDAWLVFEAPERTVVREGCGSRSEGRAVLLCHLR